MSAQAAWVLRGNLALLGAPGERSGLERGSPVQGSPGCLDCPVSGRRWGIRPGSEPPSGRCVLARAPDPVPGSSVLCTGPGDSAGAGTTVLCSFWLPRTSEDLGATPLPPHPGESFSRSSDDETDKSLPTPGTAQGGPWWDWKGASGLRRVRRQ